MERLQLSDIATAPCGRHSDGAGLYLVVKSDANRYWLFRYQFGGRRSEISLGSASDVSLDDARKSAEHYRKCIPRGVNPLEERVRLEHFRREQAIAESAIESARITRLAAGRRIAAPVRKESAVARFSRTFKRWLSLRGKASARDVKRLNQRYRQKHGFALRCPGVLMEEMMHFEVVAAQCGRIDINHPYLAVRARLNQNERRAEQARTLDDVYVRQRVARTIQASVSDVPPELVAAAREHLRINRLIKEQR